MPFSYIFTFVRFTARSWWWLKSFIVDSMRDFYVAVHRFQWFTNGIEVAWDRLGANSGNTNRPREGRSGRQLVRFQVVIWSLRIYIYGISIWNICLQLISVYLRFTRMKYLIVLFFPRFPFAGTYLPPDIGCWAMQMGIHFGEEKQTVDDWKFRVTCSLSHFAAKRQFIAVTEIFIQIAGPEQAPVSKTMKWTQSTLFAGRKSEQDHFEAQNF